MSVAGVPRPSGARPAFKPSRRAGVWLGLAAGLVVLAALGLYFINANWPYRYRKIHPLLEDVLASQVKISSYRHTYFPNPGFVATGLTLRRKSAPDLPPLGSADKIVVQGRWSDLLLLRRRVQLVEITNLHVVVPPVGSRANREDFPPGSAADFGGPETAIEHLHILNSVLDIMRIDGKRYSFPIRNLHIRDFEKGRAISYDVDMQNALPAGQIRARGEFGPLAANDLGATPVSGNFTFTSVALHDLGDIRGTLSSSGSFAGTLGSIAAKAVSTTPDFAVENGRPSLVAASVRCTVNGLNGDVAIQNIQAKTGATTVEAVGSVAGSPKSANFDIAVIVGRAEDILRPFLHAKIPITGPVWLHGHAYVAPQGNGAGFLERLRVDGVFDVPSEHITNPATEKSLSAFSQRAQGLKSPNPDPSPGDKSSASSADAVSSIKGPAEIRNGIVHSQKLKFQVPGAEANLSGTFSFHDRVVHLVGDLKMESDISHTATGFKSVLLKPFAPFFKKKNAGAVIPIAVTGGPGAYKVSQDLTHKK